MEDVFLLTHSLAIAAGFVTVTVSVQLVRSHRTAFFRAFLTQITIFNLLIILGLILADVGMRLSGGSALGGFEELPLWVFALASALKFIWLYSFVVMNRTLLGEQPSTAFRYWFVGACAAILLVDTILIVTGTGDSPDAGASRSYVITNWAAVAGCVAASGYLLVRSRDAESRLRGAFRLFGGIYLGTVLLLVLSLTLCSLVFPGRMDVRTFVNSIYLILLNLLPLVWIVRYQHLTDVSLAHRGSEIALSQEFAAGLGITPRERDVMELACAGKTNQEIADRLFISLQTVKDHMRSIYRKTEVRNRVELANLVHHACVGMGANDGADS